MKKILTVMGVMMTGCAMALALMPFMAFAVTIGEAVDAPHLTFTTGGSADWFGQTAVSHDGVDAAQSGAIDDSQSTWMQTTFTGEADVSFWWKVSSESGYDHLRFYLDGTEQDAISGDADWAPKSFHVSGSGSHTLKWTYSKDHSYPGGSDCGWVDQLRIALPEGGPYTEIVDDIEWTFMVDANLNASVGTGEWGGTAVPQSTTGAITIPTVLGGRTVTSVGARAFGQCQGITSVTIPEGVREIRQQAFWNLVYLQSVSIPSTVVHIDDDVFTCSWNLTGLTVDEWNAYYSSSDGVLYDKAKTELCFWPPRMQIALPESLRNVRPYACRDNSAMQGETLVMPSSVTNIGYYAFGGCQLGGISLNEGLKSIGYCAFRDNSGLRDVVMPSTLEHVEGYMFSGCSKLISVFFRGNAPAYVDPYLYGNTTSNLVTFARPGSTGWKTSWSSELPEAWPATAQSGRGDPRAIRTWTTYPDVSYLVRFDLGEGATRVGGGELEQYVRFGGAAVEPILSCRPGYELYRWSEDFTCVSNSMVVAALYRKDGKLPDGYNYTEQVGGYTWTFRILDGEATIVHMGKSSSGDYYEDGQRAISPNPVDLLVVPETLGGCPVVGLGYCALANCSQMTSVVLPSTLREVGRYAFAWCYQLSEIALPDGLESIGEYAFENDYGLQSLAIPASVQTVGEGAFRYCWNLRYVNVSPDNAWYSSDDGALYDKAKTELCFWPPHKRIVLPQSLQNVRPWACYGNNATQNETLVMPPSVTNVGDYAFQSCQLGGISLNEGLKSISYGAFQNNPGLRYVVMPSTLEHVEGSVYSQCPNLTSVFFKGNAPEYVDSYFYGGTPSDLVTFVRPGSTGWETAGSSELPESWPATDQWGQGHPRAIREWTTYPYVSFLVCFDLGEQGYRVGGGELEQYVREGGAAVAPEVEAYEEGYEFFGWDSEFDYITEAKTVRALYIKTGTPLLENVEASIEPAWSKTVVVSYDGLGGSETTNLTVRAYCFADGVWNSIPSSRISGDLTVLWGHHELSIDTEGLELGSGDIVFKLSVVEPAEGVEVVNYDGWTEEDESTWRSRKIGDNEETSIYSIVEGLSYFGFSWKASSESVNWDYLECFVDGESIGKIGGETDWEYMEVELTDEGEHEIVWTYRKDGSESRGRDCGWVCVEGGAGEVVCEVPVTVTISEPTMELWAEYQEDGLVALIPSLEEATIYYTLDGTIPTEYSAEYERPLTWSEFRRVRAVATTAEGDWSELMVGSEYVRITFDAALGTTDATPILRRIGAEIGDLPFAEREPYEFIGWTTDSYDLLGEYCIYEDWEVSEDITTLYAAWDVPFEDVMDPDVTLDDMTFEVDEYLQRTCAEIGYLDRTNTEWVVTNRVWKEYARFGCDMEPHSTNLALSVYFTGPGVLNIGYFSAWNADVSLDGAPCQLTQNWQAMFPVGKVKVLSAGEHQLDFSLVNGFDWDNWWSISLGGLVWKAAPTRVLVTFDAKGGKSSSPVKQYRSGNTYGTLPTATHETGYTFLGWFTDPVEGRQVSAGDLVDFEATTLYAHWRVDLGAALNNTQLKFSSSGPTGWEGQCGVSHDGLSAAASGWLEWDTTNVLSTAVQGKGVLSFWWRTTRDGMFRSPNLWLTVDGTRMELDRLVSFSRADGWRHFTLSLTNNSPHTIAWSTALGGSSMYYPQMSVREMVEMYREYGITVEVPGAWIDEVGWKAAADQTDAVNWGYSAAQVGRNLPGLSDPMIAWCDQRIAADPYDYEARVRRAITRIKALSENPVFQNLLARYGFAISPDWTKITGGFNPLTAPETNEAADELAAQALPAISLMLNDLDVIPETWQGTVALSADDYPVDEDIYVDAVDVTMARAVLHGMVAAVKTAQAYDLTTDPNKIAEELYASTNQPQIAVAPFSAPWENFPCSRMQGTNKVGFVRVASDGMKLKACFDLPEELPERCAAATDVHVSLNFTHDSNGQASGDLKPERLTLIMSSDYAYAFGTVITEEGPESSYIEDMPFEREVVGNRVYLTCDLTDLEFVESLDGIALQNAVLDWVVGAEIVIPGYGPIMTYESLFWLMADGRLYRPELTTEGIIAAHPEFASKIRNTKALQEAKDEFAFSTELYEALDRLFRQRTDEVVHFIEYDPKYNPQLDAVAKSARLAKKALNGVVTVEGKDFACFEKFKYTNETVRVTLQPFFDGQILRDLVPPFEGDLPVLSAIPDITFAGTFPDWTMQNMRPWLEKIVGIWYDHPAKPVISAPASFEGPYAEVGISSRVEGAVIRYTTDGSDPVENGKTYSAPFHVCGTTLVRAIAWTVAYGYSDETSAYVTKVPGIGDVLGSYDGEFVNDANAPWTADEEVRHESDAASMRSGEIESSEQYPERNESVLRATYSGKGSLSFWWKVSCEDDGGEESAEFDFLGVYVDGKRVAAIDGETDWEQRRIDFGSGDHVVEWRYSKDDLDEGEVGEDCGWVAKVVWVPAETPQGVLPGQTVSTWPQVPYDWLDKHGLGPRHEEGGGTFEQAAKMPSPVGKKDGSGRLLCVLDDYVAGTDPQDSTSQFKANITFDASGEPVVTYDPVLSEEEAAKRIYTTYGKENLPDKDWSVVIPGQEGYFRFFKVTVDMK